MEKEELEKHHHQQKKLKLAENIFNTQKERNEEMQRDIYIRLFQNSVSGFLAYESVEFFNILHRDAL